MTLKLYLFGCFRKRYRRKVKSKLTKTGSVNDLSPPIITTASNESCLSLSSIQGKLLGDNNLNDHSRASAIVTTERAEVYSTQSSSNVSHCNAATSEVQKRHCVGKDYSDASTNTTEEILELRSMICSKCTGKGHGQWSEIEQSPSLTEDNSGKISRVCDDSHATMEELNSCKDTKLPISVPTSEILAVCSPLPVKEELSDGNEGSVQTLTSIDLSRIRVLHVKKDLYQLSRISTDTGYGSRQLSESGSLYCVTKDNDRKIPSLSENSLCMTADLNLQHEASFSPLPGELSKKQSKDSLLVARSLPSLKRFQTSCNTDTSMHCSDSKLSGLACRASGPPLSPQYAACEESSAGQKAQSLSENALTESTFGESNDRQDNIMEKIARLETCSGTPLRKPSNLAEVLSEVKNLCEKSDIRNAIITFDPGDYKKMVVNGDGVKRLELDLERMQEKYDGYIIHIYEFTDFDLSEPFSDPPCHISLRNGSRSIGTVGLLLYGKHLKSGNTVCFGVTAAHCVLDSDAQKSANNSTGVKEAQRILEQQIKDGKWTIKPFNQAAYHPLSGFPQYRMRCFAGRGNWNDNFAHDIALLQLSERVTTVNRTGYQEGILEISFEEHINVMVERKVKVYIGEGDVEGFIIPPPNAIRVVDDSVLIPGLMLYIKTNKELLNGHSGSAIKVKYSDTSQYDVIGILHGRSKLSFSNDIDVYLGVLLYPNLHQIESDFPIKNFQVARGAAPSPSTSIWHKIFSFAPSTGYHTQSMASY